MRTRTGRSDSFEIFRTCDICGKHHLDPVCINGYPLIALHDLAVAQLLFLFRKRIAILEQQSQLTRGKLQCPQIALLVVDVVDFSSLNRADVGRVEFIRCQQLDGFVAHVDAAASSQDPLWNF
jgi:hypothetical protein